MAFQCREFHASAMSRGGSAIVRSSAAPAVPGGAHHRGAPRINQGLPADDHEHTGAFGIAGGVTYAKQVTAHRQRSQQVDSRQSRPLPRHAMNG